MERLSWIIWVGVMWSHGPFKMETEWLRVTGEGSMKIERSRDCRDALWGWEEGEGITRWGTQSATRSWKKSRKQSLPLESSEGTSPEDTLAAAPWNSFHSSDLQNCNLINLCCFQLLMLWWTVAAATGNECRNHQELVREEHGGKLEPQFLEPEQNCRK